MHEPSFTALLNSFNALWRLQFEIANDTKGRVFFSREVMGRGELHCAWEALNGIPVAILG